MPPSTRPPSDTHDIDLCALHSALRRRGLDPRNGELPGSVATEYRARQVVVRLTGGHWLRPVPGAPDSTVIVARRGNEDALALQIARELLGRLP
ncbi:hypothetical protein [Nocardiopsis halotolerans]|uniref:hypothetical protein n=1 Tax=Nocardiopsis halotolerans TaxID=124252 RepID=UPI001269221F|nr:hypothetical protein [Nocardiopsis halotolerans]